MNQWSNFCPRKVAPVSCKVFFFITDVFQQHFVGIPHHSKCYISREWSAFGGCALSYTGKVVTNWLRWQLVAYWASIYRICQWWLFIARHHCEVLDQKYKCHDDVIKWKLFRVTGFLCGEFTGRRWILRTMASDAELWCFLWSVKRLSKQSWGWWFETPSRPLWRHSTVLSENNTFQIIVCRIDAIFVPEDIMA